MREMHLLVERKEFDCSCVLTVCLRVDHFIICDNVTLTCRLLGTPTEEVWPGVSSLKDWHVYPKWEPQNLARAVPSLGPDGVDLLSV